MHSLQMHSTLTVVAIIIALSAAQSTSVSLGEIDNIFTRLGTHEGEIQLHIQWNDTVQEDWNFDVIVTTMSNFSECSPTLCYQYDIPKATKAVVLPNVIMSYAENGECVIQPGCSYNIKIASTNGKVSRTKHIDIPYCVDDVCSCQHASDLPKVKMSSSLSLNNTVDISWTISMEGKNSSQLYKELQLEKIYVSIGQQRKPSLTWGGQLRLIEERIYSIKENSNPLKADAIEGRASFQTTEPLYLEHWYQIRSHLIDKRNCTGPMEHFAIQLPQPTSSLRRNEISVTMQIAIIIISSVTLCCVTIFAMICMRRRNQRQAKNIPTVLFSHYGKPFSPDAMEDNILYVDKDIEEAQVKGLADVFEVPCTSLCIGPEIGVGAFGRVFKATAKNLMRMRGTSIVAVKQLKANPSSEEIQEFLTEINMLKGVGRHHNIVSFLGCCTIRPPYMMIMEFVGRGDLLGYLRTVRSRVSTSSNQKYSENHVSKTPAKDIEHQQRAVKYIELKLTTNSEVSLESEVGNHPKPSVTETMYTTLSESPYSMDEQEEFTFDYILDHKELHNFALQIANGMQFLEEQQITHRDLAARNVLIDDSKTLKISDFGLSRHGIYTNTKTRKLPLRWLSIEAIRDNLYSSKSDVWAFGVVLWEIGTLGASPYPTLSSNELIPFLVSGHRLEKPEICTDQVYELMLDCWHEDPLQRPSFADAYQKLQPKTVYVDISSISDDYVFPPIQEKN